MKNLKQKAIKTYLLNKIIEDIKILLTNKDVVLSEKELYDFSIILGTIKGKILIENLRK